MTDDREGGDRAGGLVWALDAKVSRAGEDIKELWRGQQAISDQVRAVSVQNAMLPSQVEEIVTRLIQPVKAEMAELKTQLTSVQATVNRWKGVLAFLAFASGGLGWLVSTIPLKKVFGP